MSYAYGGQPGGGGYNPGQPQQPQQQQQWYGNTGGHDYGQHAAAAAHQPPTQPAAPSMMMGGYGGGGGYAQQSGVQQPAWGGSMDSGAAEEDYSHEPPLLEELGINFGHIWLKTQTVLLPIKPLDDNIMDDADLAGPLFFLLAFGIFLLFTGKVHFGYIYGFGVSGCLAMYLVLNLLSVKEIDVWRVCSILGYGLLPVIVLAFLGIALSLKSTLGHALAVATIGWSTYASTRLFEKALNMSQQRWLVAYPVGLVYAIFVLITIF